MRPGPVEHVDRARLHRTGRIGRLGARDPVRRDRRTIRVELEPAIDQINA
jgi:hypothetical protein